MSETLDLGKIFDPRDPATGTGGAELLDASVVKRGNQWWMFLGGQAAGYGPTELYSAMLPPQAPLSPHGWTLIRNPGGDLAGGPHLPWPISAISWQMWVL